MAWVNLPFTVLLGIVIVYWLSVICGLSDLDSVEADAEVDGDASSGGFFAGVLQFFYIGEVPVLIVLSVMTVSLWAGMILGNFNFNPGHTVPGALIVFVPVFIASALLTRLVALPLRKVFAALNRDYDSSLPVVGRTGIVSTSEVTDSFGRVTIETGGSEIIVNARAARGETLLKGDTAIIFEEDAAHNLYLVRKLENPTLEN